MKSLLAELRRRNVFRVAAAYLLLGWVALQVVSVIENAAGLPAWSDSLVLVILVAGFPASLIVAWALELSPEGEIRKTAESTDTPVPGPRFLDYGLLAALIVFVGVVIADRALTPRPVMVATSDTMAAARADLDAAIDVDAAKSIAVLPFQDFSPAGDQAWFADGLAEEILNALARAPDLLVASRTSSFAYRGGDHNVPEIAAALGVAHVLEGSIRRAEGRLRVTAQLIRASDGFHLWSANYDRTTDDAIAIQEDIAIEIARALETAMDPQALAQMANAGTQSIAAYEAYLEGRALLDRGAQEGSVTLESQAYAAYERARTLDPDFAMAHFNAAGLYANMMTPTIVSRPSTSLSFEEALQHYLARIDAAIAATPDPNRAAYFRANRADVLGRLNAAADYMQMYAAAHPLDPDGWSYLAKTEIFRADYDAARDAARNLETLINGSAFHFGNAVVSYLWALDFNESARLARESVRAHPDNFDVLYQAHRSLLWAGDIETAAGLADRMLDFPQVPDTVRAIVAIRQGCAEGDQSRADAGLALIRQSAPEEAGTLWLALVTMGLTDEANALLVPLDRSTPPYPLSGWLFYPEFDATLFPNFSVLLDREGIVRPPAAEIPFGCPPNR
tara:strand:+ start:6616 stop:8481 length:1866 start_codon:yes stop_codon:yes gene_type:complete